MTTAWEVHAAFADLMRWARRDDLRRLLLGAAADDLSAIDVALLRAIETFGPMRMSELAARQGVDKSTLTPQARRLEERGLIERRADPSDRRVVLLSATEQGRQMHADIQAAGTHLFARVLDDWPAHDREAFGELLRRFADQLAEFPGTGERFQDS